MPIGAITLVAIGSSIKFYWEKGMTIFKRFQFALLIIVLSVAAAIVTTSYGKREDSSSDEITQIIWQFHDANPEQRSAAFYLLVKKGLGRELSGRADLIPRALSQIFKSQPDRLDELKVALMELLERENSFVQEHFFEFQRTGKALSHNYMNYYGDLILAVAALRDARALNGLLGAITTGNMATRGLAVLGADALDSILGKLEDQDVNVKASAARVLMHMLKMSSTGQVKLDSLAKEKLKLALVRSARDENPDTRINAVEGLAELAKQGDPEALSLIEQIARSDTYEASVNGEKSGSYPVREAATRVLQSLRRPYK
jgi:hypothetical protein